MWNIKILLCLFIAGALHFILKVTACSVELKIPCECMDGSQLDVMTVFLLPGEKLLILQFLQASWLVILCIWCTCLVLYIIFFTCTWPNVITTRLNMRQLWPAVSTTNCMQQRLRSVQKSVMYVQSCSFANLHLLLFCCCKNCLLLWSRNFATIVMWSHTSPLCCLHLLTFFVLWSCRLVRHLIRQMFRFGLLI